MMNKRLEWLILVVLAAAGVFLWCRLSLPRYQSIDLSISQPKAVEIAKAFLKDRRGIDTGRFRTAVSFNVDVDADRYLQKTLGIADSQRLLQDLHYDLFFWIVRFFKEQQKEEFRVAVSSASGQVLGFNHIIPDTESRETIDKEKARLMAFDFLKATYGFSEEKYVPHGEEVKKYDNRRDYAFSWRNKDVDIPWEKSTEKGHAKLLTSVTVSGQEVLGFVRYQFNIPDGFRRYFDNLKQTGLNLTLVFRLLYLALLTAAIVIVVNRKQQVVSRSVKLFYVGTAVFLFGFMVLDVLNGYQAVLFRYPTTQSFGNYVLRQFIEGLIGPFFITIAFILPALAGESIRYEVSPQSTQRSLLSNILSSFYTRSMAAKILAGYTAAGIVLGLQAVIFNLGFRYCGVWQELSWLAQASTMVIPALTGFIIGFHASFSEETMFRLFAINLFKKYGLPTVLAVLLAAVIWGFGHTGYEIFPMWFRGVEVACVGALMGFFYLRYGLATVIIAHFLVDSFWFSLPYVVKPRPSFDFYSSLFVLALPFLLALAALVLNRSSQERPLRTRFNAQQQFNYSLLHEVFAAKTPEERLVLKKDLLRHGWDEAIIERIFENCETPEKQ